MYMNQMRKQSNYIKKWDFLKKVNESNQENYTEYMIMRYYLDYFFEWPAYIKILLGD